MQVACGASKKITRKLVHSNVNVEELKFRVWLMADEAVEFTDQ